MINLYTLDLFNDSLDREIILEYCIMPRMAYPYKVCADYPNGRVAGTFRTMRWAKLETGKTGLYQILRRFLTRGDK
jgi:hypothetical protein